MKHLFWIICGVALIALLGCWFALVPTDEARKSKDKLDNQMKDLNALEKRANQGDPKGVFDAENPADTARLANEYLITEQWKRVLQPHVQKYERQLADIKGQLLGRGKWLGKVVAPTKNVLEWYSAYIEASEKLIVRLREAGCFKPAAENEEKSASGESPAAVRQIAGLYTKSGSFPEPREHPQLTTRLRAMELIADRLIASRTAIADNPVVGPTGRSDDRAQSGALIAAVEWVGGGGNEAEGGLRPLTTGIGSLVQARAIGLRLTLDGPLSALLAAVAGLERNSDSDKPLIAVTSANLARRETAAAGERSDVADDTSRLVVSLEIIEFVDPAGAAAAPAEGGAPAAPPGVPGGPPPGAGGPPTGMPANMGGR